MKQFRNKNDHSSVHVYQRAGQWFMKHTIKGKWLRTATEIGPFKSEGDALLSVCMSRELKFSEYVQVYPKESKT